MRDSDKILELIERLNLTQAKFAAKTGVSSSVISKLKGRSGSLHNENVLKIQRTFNVNPGWWETGKGDVFLEKPTLVTKVDEPRADQLIETYRKLSDRQEKEIARLEGELSRCREQLLVAIDKQKK